MSHLDATICAALAEPTRHRCGLGSRLGSNWGGWTLTRRQLVAMRAALDTFAKALEAGQDAVAADFQFHSEIARATQNEHFANLLATLGSMIIPRAWLDTGGAADAARQTYLRKVNAEHESTFDAIANGDAEAARAAMRTHLANSRERRRKLASLGSTVPTRT